jgi:hypothetical protein
MNGTNPGDPLQRGHYTNPINGQSSSAPGSPGLSGAIGDAIAALSKAFAPRSIVQRPQKIDQGVDQNVGDAPPTLGSQIGQ